MTEWKQGLSRRAALTGLGASFWAGRAAGQAPGYDYLFLDLAGAPRAQFVSHLRATARPRVQTAGGEVLGLFNPQLGWSSTEAAVLVRWTAPTAGRGAALETITRAPQVASFRAESLTPTVRPAASDRPAAGGIYVHRWFEVLSPNVAEFAELSVQGWRDFETRFEAKVFGLFQAPRTAEDERKGVTRLLLLTRYASHGVWEASRDPTTEAMQTFQRRQQLTRGSRGASSLLADLG